MGAFTRLQGRQEIYASTAFAEIKSTTVFPLRPYLWLFSSHACILPSKAAILEQPSSLCKGDWKCDVKL